MVRDTAFAQAESASEDESLRYTNAYIATSNAVGDAIIILKRLEAITFDLDEQQRIMLERRRLEDEYAQNERSFLAFHAGSLAMHPPSQEDVDSIVALASQLALLTQKKTTLSAVIKLANSVVTQFNAIRDV
jgi:hypothetical protein